MITTAVIAVNPWRRHRIIPLMTSPAAAVTVVVTAAPMVMPVVGGPFQRTLAAVIQAAAARQAIVQREGLLNLALLVKHLLGNMERVRELPQHFARFS